jgi:AcrR family transcriptional regulator
MINPVPTETRPLRADAERNRRRLLDAAAEAFNEQGLDASTAEIARRAGVGQGTVFRRFPTKEHLIAAIVVDRIGELETKARAILLHPPVEGAVLAFMRETVQQHLRDHGLIEAVIGTAVITDPEVQEAHGRLLDAVEEIIELDRGAGLLREDIGAVDVMALSKAVTYACEPVVNLGSWKRYLAVVAAGLRPTAEKLPGRSPTRAQLDRAMIELGERASS